MWNTGYEIMTLATIVTLLMSAPAFYRDKYRVHSFVEISLLSDYLFNIGTPLLDAYVLQT